MKKNKKQPAKEIPASADEALRVVEEANKQYERYIEISGIYDIARLAQPKKKRASGYTTIFVSKGR